MGKTYLISLLLTIAIAGVYWYQTTSYICPTPLTYRVGNIDDSFDIKNEEAKERIREAELLWEEQVGRELFVYDESSEFTIDFIFDERQQTSNSEEALSQSLEDRRKENEKVFDTVESLQAEYESLATSYELREATYEADLSEYNARVSQYNDRGGAPPDVFEGLESDREDLNREAENLSDTAAKLNKLVTEINLLAERGNKLVELYNQDVGQYNSEYGFSREFTQGDYQGDRIHIYKFSSDNELVTVLAHELGHALSIDHVDGSSSLMYYLLEDTEMSPILSSEDLAAYYEVCGTEETLEYKVRRKVREFLVKF